ncbi:hypothetical protein F3I02_16030 [Bacillus sp. SRB3LM]|nr:hypothetical protein [Bacillus sp. SRB3LM]
MLLAQRRAKALLINGNIQSVPSAGFGFYMPVIMKPFRQHIDYKGIFMSCVFRHFSQYKYIMLKTKTCP